MHSFSELVEGCTAFTLGALHAAEESVHAELQHSGATSLVKAVQMMHLQRAICSVGMLALFDSMLQNGLNCKNGLRKAKAVLARRGDIALRTRLVDFECAINVLKHGRGDSYDALIAKVDSLPFRVKLPDEAFFFEGDVAEVATLIEVNDKFVLDCAGLIGDVCAIVRREHPGFDL